MRNLLAFMFGGLFSIGLMFSGMSNPKKVLDFLDLFGSWDASLAFVMLGAILVALIPLQKAVKNQQPQTIFHEKIQLPQNRQIDARLIVGSLLFGIGWGIAGMCPAPSFTLIGLGHYEAVYFVGAMLIGIYAFRKISGEHA